MSLVAILIAVAVFGFVGWLITLIPMNATIKQIMIGFMVVGLILWFVQAIGWYHTGVRLR